MLDKYLNKFKELKESQKYRKEKELEEDKQKHKMFRGGYKIGHEKSVNLPDSDLKLNYLETLRFKRKGNKILSKSGKNDLWQELDPHNKGIYLGIASKLMSTNLPDYALEGAKIYEGLGVGNRKSVKRRLLKAYEKHPGLRNYSNYSEEIESFLKRNPEKKESGKTLDNKFISVIAGVLIIASLFFLSPNVTGNVIGNLRTASSNIIAIILLVFEITAFILFREK